MSLRSKSILVFLLAGVAFTSFLLLQPSKKRSEDPRPNIIFIFTDDQGFADISAHKVVPDIRTPNIDKLAETGVLMTDGYVTAPQCTPSRGALMSGRYQQKFGLDDNRLGPFPLDQPMLAELLSEAGYSTGHVGKWHLEITRSTSKWYYREYAPGSTEKFDEKKIPFEEHVKYFPNSRGFQKTYNGRRIKYWANFDLNGNEFDLRQIENKDFRVDVVSQAATTFIKEHREDPFFLYVAYYAPHVPLEAPEKYLKRFPGEMPERRRHALAMISAVDDGVGQIVKTLEEHGLAEKTILFFISDNGAPLDLTKEDRRPIRSLIGWDGSLNDPWVGEKGMLSEGAIRVPFIVNWKGHLPEGLVYQEPVIALDAPTTVAALAGLDTSGMDGINLVPYLNDLSKKPERSLYWRFWNQAAIRKGDWKYLYTKEKSYLFDLASEQHERNNLLEEQPERAESLHRELEAWSKTLKRPGLPKGLNGVEKKFYEFHLP